MSLLHRPTDMGVSPPTSLSSAPSSPSLSRLGLSFSCSQPSELLLLQPLSSQPSNLPGGGFSINSTGLLLAQGGILKGKSSVGTKQDTKSYTHAHPTTPHAPLEQVDPRAPGCSPCTPFPGSPHSSQTLGFISTTRGDHIPA